MINRPKLSATHRGQHFIFLLLKTFFNFTMYTAHQALELQVDHSLKRFPSADCKSIPVICLGGRVDQMRQDNYSPANLWDSAIRRGHSGVTLQSFLSWIKSQDHTFFIVFVWNLRCT